MSQYRTRMLVSDQDPKTLRCDGRKHNGARCNKLLAELFKPGSDSQLRIRCSRCGKVLEVGLTFRTK